MAQRNKISNTTPCDFGECPYDAQYSEDCRYYCGLGVDEDSYPDEKDIQEQIDRDFYADLHMEQQEQM